MSVKLKVLHGSLKRSGKWQVVVPVKKTPFVIGQAEDCDMRCFGKAISQRHCEITVRDSEIFVADLRSTSGTFLNNGRIAERQPFWAGDRLRIGRLEFELLVDHPQPARREDEFGDYISDMLMEADEAEREATVSSPESRWYKVEPVEPADPYEGLSEQERLLAKARAKIPEQREPGKLPSRRFLTESANQAVSEWLATNYQGTGSLMKR